MKTPKITPDSFFSGGQVLGMIALCGKPGAGKGIESLRLIIAELLDPDSQRIIVTNCSLHLAKITEFLAARGREDINVYERIYVLSWEETPKFYLRRSLSFLGEETRPDPKLPPQVDFSTFPETPVLYVLDEAHEFFNSRNWQRVSNDTAVLAYVSKHRHLGDGIIWISQTIASVDRQFRERSQEYRITRNWAKERYGRFSKGTGFRVSSYLQPPTPSEKPQWEEERRPLPDFFACYSTSLYNKSADVGKVVKGLNIRKWIFAIVPLALTIPVGLYFLTDWAISSLVGDTEEKPSIFTDSEDEAKSDKKTSSSPKVEPSPDSSPVLVYTSQKHWNPLEKPSIDFVSPSDIKQQSLAPIVIPPHPIPFQTVGFFGGMDSGFHTHVDGRIFRMGDYWHGLRITAIRSHCIITGRIIHPVVKVSPKLESRSPKSSGKTSSSSVSPISASDTYELPQVKTPPRP